LSNIHLLWPTIRPFIMVKFYNKWINNSSKKHSIHLKVAVNTPKQMGTIRKLLGRHTPVINIGNNKIGVTRAATALSRNFRCKSDDEIVILASDDIKPFLSWDQWVIDQLEGKTGCLIVNDGNNQGGVVTIPIMTYGCLKQLNYIIYHPAYNHLYSDAELMDVLKELDLAINLRESHPDKIFTHLHWGNKKRDKDPFDFHFMKTADRDYKLYKKRKAYPAKMKIQMTLKI